MIFLISNTESKKKIGKLFNLNDIKIKSEIQIKHLKKISLISFFLFHILLFTYSMVKIEIRFFVYLFFASFFLIRDNRLSFYINVVLYYVLTFLAFNASMDFFAGFFTLFILYTIVNTQTMLVRSYFTLCM